MHAALLAWHATAACAHTVTRCLPRSPHPHPLVLRICVCVSYQEFARVCWLCVRPSRLLALLFANNTSVCPTMLARPRAVLTTTFRNISQSPQPRSQAAAAVDGTSWYVTGGVDTTGAATASTYRFDSTTRSWATLAPLNYPRAGHGLVVVNRCVLLLHACDVLLVNLPSVGYCCRHLLLCPAARGGGGGGPLHIMILVTQK
jgi:hypothetical protein